VLHAPAAGLRLAIPGSPQAMNVAGMFPATGRGRSHKHAKTGRNEAGIWIE
jgi:hypothetical protein